MMSGERCCEWPVDTEADPYEVAEQVFRFRAKQLQAAGKLPQDAYENEEEFAVYSRKLTELYHEIHEEMELLWPPPWVGET